MGVSRKKPLLFTMAIILILEYDGSWLQQQKQQ